MREPRLIGTTARSAWLGGLVVGVAAGFGTLEFPTLGWLLVIAFAVGADVSRRPLPAAAGLLTGLGMSWVVLLGRVALTCRATDGEVGCHAPGIEPWLAVGLGMLATGVMLTVLEVARQRRSR